MSQPPMPRDVVPTFLLARFADETGRVMAERRDRTRRLALSVREAVAQAGSYTLPDDSPRCRRIGALLTRIEERAAGAIQRVVDGAFPPAGEDRTHLALLLAFQLLFGRGHREALARTAELLGTLIVHGLPDREEEEDETTEESEPGAPIVVTAAERPTPESAHIVAPGRSPVPVSLEALPHMARSLVARTWQLLRFPERLLLSGDTPVVLWSRPGVAKPHQYGLGTADEVRVPLDPRHALILARRAPSGEVVRELGERHARALNRTVAEAAAEWMYYHPDSDPLEAVELAPL